MTPDPQGIPTSTPNALDWLDRNWPFAGTVAAVFLACLLPLVAGVWPAGLTLTYLMLLLYLAHQIEEHFGDRFRRFVNEHVGGGANALTPRATMFINVAEVWGVFLIVLLLTGLVDVGFGLIIAYTVLLNAVLHIVAAALLRGYNPGLWTALALFAPFGAWTLVVVGRASGLGTAGHIIGVLAAVVVHALVILGVRRRLARLAATRTVAPHVN